MLKTQGDMVLDKSLMELGGKGLFTKEVSVARRLQASESKKG